MQFVIRSSQQALRGAQLIFQSVHTLSEAVHLYLGFLLLSVDLCNGFLRLLLCERNSFLVLQRQKETV